MEDNKEKEILITKKNKQEDKHHTPFYYIKKRLFANIPAVFGMFIIFVAVIISALGYSIMPDNTPYANGRVGTIAKKPPGFEVKMIKIRKNQEIEQRGFFKKMLFGQESSYRLFPFTSQKSFPELMVVLAKYEEKTSEGDLERIAEEKIYIVDAVLPLYVGDDKVIKKGSDKKYHIDGNQVHYLDLEGNKKTISRKELITRFNKECIETRHYRLGTDVSGRDILSLLLFGVRVSLGIGIISVIISFIVGFTLGSLAGFFGGAVDNFIMWFMSVVWSIPGIMLVIAISLAFQSRGVWVAFVAVGLTTWVEIARVVRGQIMSVKQKLYVEAARALGIPNRRIIFSHILPNIIGPLIVIMTSNFASAILIEAGLSFLGLGVQSPMSSWGMMIEEGRGFITHEGKFYLVLYPSICIAIMVLAFNLFGNGLRDAYDPKTITKK